MRQPGMLVTSLALGTMACSTPFPCTRYCWSHKQDVPDVVGEDLADGPDGRFDVTCTTFGAEPFWHPPLPQFGWYSAEACLPADEHQIIAETVAAIEDPMTDASQSCDVTDLQIYSDLVQVLAMQAREACVDHLTCKRDPFGCDIDPTAEGNQACSVPSAENLCDEVVLAPALAALSDLSNGPGAAQPQRDGSAIQYVDDPQGCEPLLQDTDTPPCDGPGGDGGANESGTGDTGVDESGGGGGIGPFGDIGSLVSCTSRTSCIVESELLRNIQSNFWVFHDDGVRLEAVSISGLGGGVRISGFDRGETSEQLLDAFSIADGDVLTHVNGASLGSMTTIEEVFLDLATADSWRITVRRPRGSSWVSLDYSIARGR